MMLLAGNKKTPDAAPGGLVRLMGCYFRYVDMAICCERRRRAVSTVTHVLGLSAAVPMCVCVRDTTAVAVGSAAVGRAYSHDCTSNIDNVDSRMLYGQLPDFGSLGASQNAKGACTIHTAICSTAAEKSQPACSVHTVRGSHSRWYGVLQPSIPPRIMADGGPSTAVVIGVTGGCAAAGLLVGVLIAYFCLCRPRDVPPPPPPLTNTQTDVVIDLASLNSIGNEVSARAPRRETTRSSPGSHRSDDSIWAASARSYHLALLSLSTDRAIRAAGEALT